MPVDTTHVKLSGSTDGLGILVAASASPGTTIHDATASTTTTWDEVHLWACNTDTAARKLTLEVGGTTAAHLIEVTIPAEAGEVKVLDGCRVQNSANIDAFAASANVINIRGWVNRHVNS